MRLIQKKFQQSAFPLYIVHIRHNLLNTQTKQFRIIHRVTHTQYFTKYTFFLNQ